MKVPTTAIRIRKARLTDAVELEKLYGQLHRHYVSLGPSRMRRGLRRVILDPDEALLVAVSGKRLVGTTHVHIFRHLARAMRPAAIIENVVVDQEFRRRGVGKLLMDAATAIAKKNNCYKAALTSGRVRGPAHNFYRQTGWTWTHYGFTIQLPNMKREKGSR